MAHDHDNAPGASPSADAEAADGEPRAAPTLDEALARAADANGELSTAPRDESGRLRIVWYGSPAPRQVLEQRSLAVVSGDIAELIAGDAPSPPTRAAVLDAAGFDDLNQLRAAYHQLSCPVLMLAPAESAPAVLGWLRPADDLALSESPNQLLLHRLRQLDAQRSRALDALTGLPRRAQLDEALARLLPLCSEAHPLSLLLIDIDHFKRLNDTYGHAAGDQVIRELGAIVASTAPQAEELARYGGELFGVLINAGETRAYALAQALRQAIAAHRFPEEISVTASIGVASADVPLNPEALLQQAQEAVYAAKAAGRDRVVSFTGLERDAAARDEDVALASFENLTQVVAQRVAEMLTWRGRKLFERLRLQAENDALTGLHARRYLDRRLAHEVDVADAGGERLCAALFDLDHFGAVNKEHGWPSGDKVLKDLAQLLEQDVRQSDWLARYGGEEFSLVMPQTTLHEATKVVERLRETVEAHGFTSTSGEPIPLTVSAGVAALDTAAKETPTALLERLSSKLLEAKRGGRNRVAS
jgi:two-component system cell cycle response regulator